MCVRSCIALIAGVVTLGLPAFARAEPGLSGMSEPRHTGLRQSVERQLALPVIQPRVDRRLGARSRQTPPNANRPGFVKRHPVISGLLMGMSAGTAVAAAAWGNEGAFVGLYSGAAAGAALGWALSR